MCSSRHMIVKLSSGPATIFGFYHRIFHCHALPGRVDANHLKDTSGVILFSLKSSCFRSLRPLSSSGPEPRESEGVIADGKLQEELGKLGIKYDPQRTGKTICSLCGGGVSQESSFSLSIQKAGKLALWKCFRAKCGWEGCIKPAVNGEGYTVKQNFGSRTSSGASKRQNYKPISEEDLQLEPLCPELIGYFNARSISIETLDKNNVKQRILDDEIVIAFTYRRNGKLVSCNYLNIETKSWQEKDTESIFYGLDDLVPGSEIIIVDNEIDKLSMQETGYLNCISVPNGKLLKISEKLPAECEDASFQYLWKCKEYLEKAPRIILATCADSHGHVLAEELARRLGKERCWRVKWPMKNATEVCIDANEVLNIFGEHVLKEIVEKAEMFPVRGLLNFSNFFPEINDYYHCTQGFELGVSTGWRALDDLYNIVPGELTVITGVPNSGKSEWIDALLCNINDKRGWRFALCSMENQVQEHARKLLEKHVEKPFFNLRYGESIERMSLAELEEGKMWLNDTFHVIRSDNDNVPSVDWVLMIAKVAVLRYGVRGLVIDPYNELDHDHHNHQTETEYVSCMLTKMKRFAQHYSCHVWFVAHPRQLQNWRGNPPDLYDISGSAHFINKCDNGIVIHRDKERPHSFVQVSVRKVRNKVVGRVGDSILSYDRVTGLFHDIDNRYL